MGEKTTHKKILVESKPLVRSIDRLMIAVAIFTVIIAISSFVRFYIDLKTIHRPTSIIIKNHIVDDTRKGGQAP